jgi:hypothetical protein
MYRLFLSAAPFPHHTLAAEVSIPTELPNTRGMLIPGNLRRNLESAPVVRSSHSETVGNLHSFSRDPVQLI